MAIHLVPTHLVPDLWDAIEPHVESACKDLPFLSSQDIEGLLYAGRCQLFIHVADAKVTGFAVMDVIYFPSRKVANVLAAGGDKGFLSAAILELLPELKKWGAQQGADTFAISGRPGWLRVLRDHGFQSITHVTLWADLDGFDIRRRIEQHADTDHGESAVVSGTAVPH